MTFEGVALFGLAMGLWTLCMYWGLWRPIRGRHLHTWRYVGKPYKVERHRVDHEFGEMSWVNIVQDKVCTGCGKKTSEITR